MPQQLLFSPSNRDFIFFCTVGYGYKKLFKIIVRFCIYRTQTTQKIATIGRLVNMKFSLLMFFLMFTPGSAYFCEVCLFVWFGFGLFFCQTLMIKLLSTELCQWRVRDRWNRTLLCDPNQRMVWSQLGRYNNESDRRRSLWIRSCLPRRFL